VGTAKLAADAVTSAKITDATIVAGDLAADAVTSAKILDGTIAAGDLAADAVTSAKILDLTIATADLAADAVTDAKVVDTLTASNYLPLAGGTLSGNVVMPDAATLGQAAGPLLTFDDTNNDLALTGGSLGLGTTAPAATEPGKVSVHATAFNPATVEAKAGEEVVWTVDDGGLAHTITADDGSFDSGNLASGEFRQAFEQPGEYPYHCTVHAKMKGKVTVG
jgi:plastocyanin